MGETDHSKEKPEIVGSTVFYLICVLPCLLLAWQVMNEVALHRGRSPHLNTIDAFVDGQHLTEAVVCAVEQ